MELGGSRNIMVDTLAMEAHFSDPANHLKLIHVPTGVMGTKMHCPFAPILPETLGDWVLDKPCTPWEVWQKIEAVSAQWDQAETDATKPMLDFICTTLCVQDGKGKSATYV